MKKEEIEELLSHDISILTDITENNSKKVEASKKISDLRIFKFYSKKYAPYILTYTLILATAKFSGLGLPFYSDYENKYSVEESAPEEFKTYDEYELLNGKLFVTNYFKQQNNYYKKIKSTFVLCNSDIEIENKYHTTKKREGKFKNYIVTLSSMGLLLFLDEFRKRMAKKIDKDEINTDSMNLRLALNELKNSDKKLEIRKDNYEFLFEDRSDTNVKH